MNTVSIGRKLTFLLLLPFFPLCTLAQSSVTGFPPYGSFQPGGVDSVDRQSLNVNFAIPIAHSPGRGIDLNFALVYNSLIWKASGGVWTPVVDAAGNPTWGWNFIGPLGRVHYSAATQSCSYRYFDEDSQMWIWGNEYYTEYNNYTFTDAQGTVHPYSFDWYDGSGAPDCGPGYSSPDSGMATDGSGIYLDAATNYVTFRNGLTQQGDNLIDANGNIISRALTSSGHYTWTDSANRQAVKVVIGSSSTDYQFLGPTGSYQTISVLYQSYNIKTNFGCSYVEYTGTASLPYEIDLPNGKKYLITYQPTPSHSGYVTGRVQKVTLPTGGYYQYDYTGSYDGIDCSTGTVVSMTRTIYDGTNSPQWLYARTVSSGTWTNKTTAPVMPYDSTANDSVFTFNSSGQETMEKYYQGSASGGTLLTEVDTTWASNGSPSRRVTVLDSTHNSAVDTTYDSNGHLTQSKEYDWTSSLPGTLIRETDMTYTNVAGWRLTQKIVKDGSGNVKYREDRSYDGSTPTCVTGAAQHDDSNFGCSFNSRGNLTSITTYDTPATPAGGVTKYLSYDTLGNIHTTAVGSTQQDQLNYSSTTNYFAPDSVVSGPSSGTQLTKSATYDAYTGAVATSTDENGKVTTHTYDSYGRLTTVTRSDSTNFTTAYDDTNFIVTSTSPFDSSQSVKQLVAFDGLGRPITTTLEDGSSTVYAIVTTQYDPVGRAYKASNPYTSSPSYWTETRFDGLGRNLKAILPDSSQATVSYSVNCATATGAASKARKTCSDGLGRLTSVFEDPSTLNYETDYSYNTLDLLTQVSQGSQTRTYSYDGMGRTTGSTTPEAGSVSQIYNGFNLVTSFTDARGVVTNYSYDTLNRLTQASYNVGSTGVTTTSTVNYTYDSGGSSANALGRLTSMSDGVGSETYTYDGLGRISQLQKVIGSTTYTTSYSYNLASELTQITYPSTRSVYQTYDSVGRLCAVGASGSSCSSGTRYAYGYGFNTAQQVAGMTYGNGVTANFSYSADRLQLHCLQYATVSVSDPCTNDSTALFMLTYAYNSSGSNDGLISGIADGMDSGRNTTYTYDALSRLNTASTTGSSPYPAWGLSWTYDRYGNRTAQSVTAGTAPYNSLTVSASTIRITDTGFSHDSSGNMTNDGLNTLAYDAASRLISSTNGSSSGGYSYDGNGLRVKKCVPTCTSPTTTTVYIFSGGKVIAEYENGAGTGSPAGEYIYSAGSLVAKIASSTTTYYHNDHLSNRQITNSSGGSAEQLGHFPFGESWYDTGSEKLKFTTFERDLESGTGSGSGNDYAMARYDVNRLGRFSSPDPLGLASATLSDPQSLNRYSHVRNNPLNLTDPSGLDPNYCDPLGLQGRTCPYDADDGDPSGRGCALDGIAVNCGSINKNGVTPCVRNDCSFTNETHEVCIGGGRRGEDCFTLQLNGVTGAEYTDMNGNYISAGALQEWEQYNGLPVPGFWGALLGMGTIQQTVRALADVGIYPSPTDDRVNPFHSNQSNFRDLHQVCSVHATINNVTGRTSFHTDTVNPILSVPVVAPSPNVPGEIFNLAILVLHGIADVVPYVSGVHDLVDPCK